MHALIFRRADHDVLASPPCNKRAAGLRTGGWGRGDHPPVDPGSEHGRIYCHRTTFHVFDSRDAAPDRYDMVNVEVPPNAAG